MTTDQTITAARDDRLAVDSLPALEPLTTGPATTVRAAIARRLFRAAVSRLDVTVIEVPTGRTWGRGGPVMRLHRPEEFHARLGRDGLIGFGESYLTGAWDAPDLAEFLTVPAARISTLIPPVLQRLRTLATHRVPRHHRSTTDNSRANVAHHYDLSNELFALFLDDTMSYSSALFDPCPDEDDFAQAQGRKIERLLDAAGVTSGTRLLEIGTGWGELAIRAARRGATVHSITLSSEQLELARDRVEAAGFGDAVRIELMDYRDLTTSGATYDAVVSVEMIEAVGHEFWGTYFSTIDQVLAPGGRVAIQAITMPHDRMLATRDTHTWITKYIFPGGFLPSLQALDEVTRAETSLRLQDRLQMGDHYAETLARWDARFLAQRDAVAALGFDDLFVRMWHFYLAYSQAGFSSGYIDVWQLTFTRDTTTQEAR